MRTSIKDIYGKDPTAPAASSPILCGACNKPTLKPTTVLFGARLGIGLILTPTLTLALALALTIALALTLALTLTRCGLTGQAEAVAHAKASGHTNFSEFK